MRRGIATSASSTGSNPAIPSRPRSSADVDRSNPVTPIGHQPDGTSVARGQPPEGKEALMARIIDTLVSTLHPVVQARNAGYGQPPASAPLHECISSFNGTGSMGFHFINGGLLDANLDPTRPEALVYEPDAKG